MGTGAAFFDLDRTLLAGASGPVLSEALRAAGVSTRGLPGERFLYGVFEWLGENLVSIALLRQTARLARGRSQRAVQEAAAAAAPLLAARVQPYARGLIAAHREAGRPVVMATTTPYDLIAPLAGELGLDDVIATRYGVRPDGTYDGNLEGPFVWSAGKLSAVRVWAALHDVELARSWAYSDSVYDSPLLSTVGHPVAVNPDPRLLAVARARRWPVLHLDAPPGVWKVPVLGLEAQQLVLALARPELMPYVRFDLAGVERIPPSGPVLVVANHRSYFDVAALAVLMAKAGRTARFLAKKELFDAPVVGAVVRAMGGIRVDRGSGSEEPLRDAAEALAAGDLVVVMPQGTIPRGAAFFDPVLRGRWGAARLARLSGAPVVPVGLWGTERVWPRSARLPNVLSLAHPPRVAVTVGPPVTWAARRALARDTDRIMAAITALLPPVARVRHQPTAAELARTVPPGARGAGHHGDAGGP